MADGVPFAAFVCGTQGSGKSTLARQMIDGLAGKYRYLVVLNNNSEFSELCKAQMELDDDCAGVGYDWQRILRDQGSLHVEITAVEAKDALDQLGRAIYALGNCLVVVDESHEIVTKAQAPRGLLQLWTGGRKRNIYIIAISQSILQSPSLGVEPTVIRRSNVRAFFRLEEPREVERVMEFFPELGERVADLAMPGDGMNSEYATRWSGPMGIQAGINSRSGWEWLRRPEEVQ